MDFFKSVFADEPSDQDQNDDALGSEPSEHHGSVPDDPVSNEAWSFGGLIKTLATKSESVIQNYRRDLEEFGSGLKMETAVIRDAASRAVKDLPASLEVGATVAQESLESVGQAIDDIGSSVWKSTAEIITHGRETLLAADDADDDHSDVLENNSNSSKLLSFTQGLDSKPYSRFEAQVRAIQGNTSTYMEEPEDLENYRQWKLGFVLDDEGDEIENLMKENGEIGGIYGILVPNKIEHESFWLRYFYRIHKLKEVEDARVKLVKRAISGEEDELSWDFDEEDEDEDEQHNGSFQKAVSSVEIGDNKGNDKDKTTTTTTTNVSNNGENSEGAASKFDETVVSEEGKSDNSSSDSCKDSDVSIVSRPEEEDLGWDEIEDIGSNDEIIKAVGSSSSRAADPRKRLSNGATDAEEEDEDLSWDIEDE